MIVISLGQPARPSRLGMRAITAAIKAGRLSRDSGRYLVGPVQLREQFEMGNVASRPQEFAGGFVDFLLGRGARHPRLIPPRPSED
jgi:hypothetical protein